MKVEKGDESDNPKKAEAVISNMLGQKNGSFSWQQKQKIKRPINIPLKAIIKQVDKNGLLKIVFNRAIFVTPNISIYNNETIKIKVQSAFTNEEDQFTQRNITKW